MNIKTKKELKQLSKILIFVIVASLPFITLTNIIGMETFLDSFENPEAYICMKNSDDIQGLKTQDEQYILIQKTTHPDFQIEKNDEIIYFNIDGEIKYNKILDITGAGLFKKYYIQNQNEQDDAIYETQIVGKIIKNIDSNIWNELSVKLWEISIKYLNIQKVT